MIHTTCKNYSNFCDWAWITIFWKIGLLYYKFCFLTPFKDGIIHVTKSIRISAVGQRKTRKRESSLKDHSQDLPKTGWSSFDHLFSISLAHSRQTEIFRRVQPLLKPGREGCTDIRAAHVLLSLCDTVLINAAKAESHIFLQRTPGNLWCQHYYIPFLATQL